MGLFSSGKNTKKLSSKEIHRALYGISGIDKRERDEILDALESEKDFGGISEYELERVLRNLRKEDVISISQANIIKKKLFG
jgi:hypothetical protein